MCNDGYISSDSTQLTQILAGSEYCIPIIISPLITTTSDSITVSVGSDNAGFVVGNIVEVTRQGEINIFCTISIDIGFTRITGYLQLSLLQRP